MDAAEIDAEFEGVIADDLRPVVDYIDVGFGADQGSEAEYPMSGLVLKSLISMPT